MVMKATGVNRGTQLMLEQDRENRGHWKDLDSITEAHVGTGEGETSLTLET